TIQGCLRYLPKTELSVPCVAVIATPTILVFQKEMNSNSHSLPRGKFMDKKTPTKKSIEDALWEAGLGRRPRPQNPPGTRQSRGSNSPSVEVSTKRSK